MFSKYNSTKKFWIKKHKSNTYAAAENVEKNNKISRTFIEKYINDIKDVQSIQELGIGSGRNLNIFFEFFPKIKFFGNDISPNVGEYIKKTFPNLYKILELTIQDTENYLKISPKVDLTFTHGHLMHLPNQIIDNVCKNIANKTNKYILIREAYTNKPGVGFLRKMKYRKYRFDRDYLDKFPEFKLIDKLITDHPTKKWVRQGEYLFERIST